jgi:hypothetical protein
MMERGRQTTEDAGNEWKIQRHIYSPSEFWWKRGAKYLRPLIRVD